MWAACRPASGEINRRDTRVDAAEDRTQDGSSNLPASTLYAVLLLRFLLRLFRAGFRLTAILTGGGSGPVLSLVGFCLADVPPVHLQDHRRVLVARLLCDRMQPDPVLQRLPDPRMPVILHRVVVDLEGGHDAPEALPIRVVAEASERLSLRQEGAAAQLASGGGLAQRHFVILKLQLRVNPRLGCRVSQRSLNFHSNEDVHARIDLKENCGHQRQC